MSSDTVIQRPEIDLARARLAIAAAERAAADMGVRASVVVLDRAGDLVASARMDGAWPGAFDLALGKAQTARAFLAPSGAFVSLIQPGQPLFSVSSVASGRYVILGGGFPLQLALGGEVAGAIGVSGGTPEQDVRIAEQAVSALLSHAAAFA